jgi:predicted RNA polymerase sigma factor
MAEGPAAGLALVEPLLDDKALRQYPWLPSVHADLLGKLGRHAEAQAAWRRAAELAQNGAERALLLERARAAG